MKGIIMRLKIVILSIFLAVTLVVAGCNNEGPAEKAGEKIDETVQDVGEAVEDAGDEIEDAADK
jgi:predicted small secreted protein